MEKFKKIKDWEGSYEISNYGNIKCLNYLHHKEKTHITKGILCNNGYLKYELKANGRKKVFLIHRLVAIHFIPNPKNKPCVNHKDGNKQNNCVENLEWCTYKENSNHALKNGLSRNTLKPFKGINTKTNEEIFFDNIQDASDFVKGNRGNIHKCLQKKNNRTIAYGYRWEYVTTNILQSMALPI